MNLRSQVELVGQGTMGRNNGLHNAESPLHILLLSQFGRIGQILRGSVESTYYNKASGQGAQHLRHAAEALCRRAQYGPTKLDHDHNHKDTHLALAQ